MENLKEFYSQYADQIISKRFQSPYPLRRHAHLAQYDAVAKYAVNGAQVLDAGCGEGVLSVMMTLRGAAVTGIDLSEPNIEAAKNYAKDSGIPSSVHFQVGDAENLPFPDSSFDLVVSSHVLEHLPDFDKGLSEVMRVTKKRAIIAIPTILNPASMVQVGHGWYYLKGIRSFTGLPVGMFKTVIAFLLNKEGVDEGYVGTDATHIFRFPWVMKKKIEKAGFHLVSYEASSVMLPYFNFLLPLVRFLDKHKTRPCLRNFGYGTTYIVEKN